MPYDELDEVCRRMNALDVEADGQKLVDHAASIWQEHSREVQTKIAKAVVGYLKQLPQLIEQMRTLTDAPETPLALRKTLLLGLSYVADRQDLIQDDTPGYYGYIDDMIILQAIAREANKAGGADADEIAKNEALIAFFSALLSPAKRKELQEDVNQIAALCQLLLQTPEELLAASDELILDTPTNPVPASDLPADAPHVTALPGGGSIYTEPNLTSVSFAGGGGAALVGRNVVVW